MAVPTREGSVSEVEPQPVRGAGYEASACLEASTWRIIL
jgi:hypothetical protein